MGVREGEGGGREEVGEEEGRVWRETRGSALRYPFILAVLAEKEGR